MFTYFCLLPSSSSPTYVSCMPATFLAFAPSAWQYSPFSLQQSYHTCVLSSWFSFPSFLDHMTNLHLRGGLPCEV
ncbi:hypothetical protein OIU84_002074 [Salix udensis]|uniref:Uncharacterized protein n=1 Tax=Salix udensis TaxID=889485 RepID=A0AAD6KAP3_9ROSI|nr:hypothetical protein OIU84_002074 [Salix udensis]